jgi:iron complex transport system ATP-binding protein
VVHDLNLAAQYCDRVYLLRHGRVDASGPTAEVFTYANLSRVFETDLYVDQNSITGKLMVVPLSGRAKAALAQRGDSLPPHGPSSAARSNE